MAVFHKDQIVGDIHIINNFTYTDIASLEVANSFVSSDIGKVAIITEGDFKQFFVLLDHNGPVWQALDSGLYAFAQTTNTTPLTVHTLTLNDEETYVIRATAVCQLDSASTDQSYIVRHAMFYRTGAGIATIEGASTEEDAIRSSGFTDTDILFTVSTNDVLIQVLGIAATTINWKVWIEFKKAFS